MSTGRALTLDEIERFSTRKLVARIAVENFLMTVTNNPDRLAAYLNAKSDAHVYGWNGATLKAIQDGIRLAFSGR